MAVLLAAEEVELDPILLQPSKMLKNIRLRLILLSNSRSYELAKEVDMMAGRLIYGLEIMPHLMCARASIDVHLLCGSDIVRDENLSIRIVIVPILCANGVVHWIGTGNFSLHIFPDVV